MSQDLLLSLYWGGVTVLSSICCGAFEAIRVVAATTIAVKINKKLIKFLIIKMVFWLVLCNITIFKDKNK